MPVDELKHQIDEHANLQVLDVRRPAEYSQGHVPGALNFTLSHIERDLGNLDPNKPTAVVCQSGYRSSAASSFLQRAGFQEVYNVMGGTAAWTGAGYSTEK
jgi:hydroxyacylglutathione hydrolase